MSKVITISREFGSGGDWIPTFRKAGNSVLR